MDLRSLGSRVSSLELGFRVSGLRFFSLGLRAKGLGLWVQFFGLSFFSEFRVRSLGSRNLGSAFRS